MLSNHYYYHFCDLNTFIKKIALKFIHKFIGLRTHTIFITASTYIHANIFLFIKLIFFCLLSNKSSNFFCL